MLASPSAIKLREYERIFTGSNQQFGYENPILDFVSDTTLQVFPTDQVTYFHYPISAPSGLLIDSDLVNCGAVAGSIPYEADKIWKKMANYSTNSIWGNSQPIGKQTGIWLCAWLSADFSNPSSVPIWIDRWYNPGYIDNIQAMFIATPLSAVITDIPSEMILESGCWYKYFHVGNLYNTTIVNRLTGLNSLVLHIDDWSENPIDKSSYNNICKIENYTTDAVSTNGVNFIERPLDNCVNLNGLDQHCTVLHNSSYTLTGDLSYSLWAYAANWNSIQGNNLVSKDYRGGWDLKYNNGFINPYIITANLSGLMVFLNSNGEAYYSKNLPSYSEPIAMGIDTDLFTWILDNGIHDGSKHLYKIDYNGDIRNQVIFNSSIDLKDLIIDKDNNLHILHSNGLYTIDQILTIQSATNLSPYYYATFTNNYNDTSKYNLPLTYHTSAITFTEDRFGNINKAAYFNGNDQYILQDIQMGKSLSAVSYSYWFTIDDVSIAPNAIYTATSITPLSSNYWHTRAYVVVDNISRKVQSYHQTYTGTTAPDFPQAVVVSNSTIDDNTWYHVVEVTDRINGKAKLYINGTLESEVTGIQTANTFTGDFTGSYYSPPYNEWSTTIGPINSGTNLTHVLDVPTLIGHHAISGTLSILLTGNGPAGYTSAIYTDIDFGILSSTDIIGTSGTVLYDTPFSISIDTISTILTAGKIYTLNFQILNDNGYYIEDNFLSLGSARSGSGKLYGYCVDHKGKIDDFMAIPYAITDQEAMNLYTESFTVSTNNNCNHIDITKDNQIRIFNADGTTIDNDSNAWIAISGNLYKESNLILSGLSTIDAACDKDNNIWILNGITDFMKLSSDGTFILSGTVDKNMATNYRNISFTNEYEINQYKDYAWFINENERCINKYDTNGNFIKKINLNIYDLYPTLTHFTNYDWNRKFNYLKYNKLPQIQSDITLFLNNTHQKYTLSIPTTAISNNDWHMFTFTYNQSSINLYMDSILRESFTLPNSSYIYYEYENPLIIGANVGKITTIDEEVDTQQLHFKGKIDDLRIYNIILNNSDIRHLYLNKFNYHDLKWNMPTGEQSYLEEIERFFKFKLTGAKSQYFNIKLVGLGITDLDTRIMIEDIIKNTIKKVTPAYTELYKIIWE